MNKNKIMFLYLGILFAVLCIDESEGFTGPIGDELGKAPKASLKDAMKRNPKFRGIALKVAKEDSDDMDTDDILDDINNDVDEIIGEDYPEPTHRTELEDFGPDEN